MQGNNPAIEAGYVWTHFALETYEPLEGGEVHLYGEFNNFVLDDSTKLECNPSTGAYETARLFKQGYYDYKYVFLRNDGILDEGFISGNFVSTENEYTVLIYYHPPGGRYTRIIGLGSANSLNIQINISLVLIAQPAMMEKKRLLPSVKKERHELKYRNNECLNCHHPLDISDEYCPRCGQLNTTKKLSFNDFFNEFFAGIFAYDSRFYRTLGVLLFKPGKISKDYIEGKRVRYANPYRFYLSASILFFLVWSLTHDFDNSLDTQVKTTDPQEIKEADSILAAQRAQNPNLGLYLPETIGVDTTAREKKYVPHRGS